MSASLWHALITGTAVALAAGPIGYLLVLRAQMFTADALSHVAFAGALAALALGWDLRVGLFAVTIAVAVGLGLLGPRGRPDDVVIGGVFAWVLGLGVFFLSYYTRGGHGSDGTAGVRVLFGSILGLSRAQTVAAVVLELICVAAIATLARPLVFASLDPLVAVARGVPVALLGWSFLVLLGITASEASQVVGAAAIAVGSVWAGLAAAQLWPRIPPSFAIVAFATACYLIAGLIEDPFVVERRLSSLTE
jgi:zinc/manganese transport system permease protein